MKGIIFTQLVLFLEQRFDEHFADAVLEAAALPNGGAFTSVGSYPAAQALTLLATASRLCGQPAETLTADYGSFLYDRFATLFPAIMSRYRNAEDLLSHVGPHIHEEVQILYPDAHPPRVSAGWEDGVFVVRYDSHRPLAMIAYGLVRRALQVHGDPRTLRLDVGGTQTRAVFRLEAMADAA